MPPNIQDWVPPDDFVHRVAAMANRVLLNEFVFHRPGVGGERYHPCMLLVVLVYCYALGVFSSRKIEQATCHHVVVQFVSDNSHPDHATIAKFRR